MKLLTLFAALVSANRKIDVTNYVTKTNTWTCRACFNVRVEFKFDQVGIKGKNFRRYLKKNNEFLRFLFNF